MTFSHSRPAGGVGTLPSDHSLGCFSVAMPSQADYKPTLSQTEDRTVAVGLA